MRKYRPSGVPLLKRFAEKKFLYVVMSLFLVVSLVVMGFEGYKSYTSIRKGPEKVSSFLDVTPANSPGNKWAAEFLKPAPPGVSEWDVSDSQTPAQPFSYQECSAFNLLPPTVYATHTAAGKNVKVFVQLYYPGTAKKSFDNYKKILSHCWSVSESDTGNPKTSVYSFENGKAFLYGDALIVVASKDKKIQKNTTDWLMKRAVSTLQASRCYNLSESTSDISRNFYAASKEYKGYVIHDRVQTKVNLEGFPTQIYRKVNDFSSMSAPEKPLPDGMPDREPNKPFDMPSVPDAPTPVNPGNFEKNLHYQDPDEKGPGCGWEWGGLKAPGVDKSKLSQLKKEAYENAQKASDKKASEFVESRNLLIRSNVFVARDIETWNRYVSSVDGLHRQWKRLEEGRDLIEDSWRIYVNRHNDWLNFDNIQYNAKIDYDNAVKKCVADHDAFVKWQDRYTPIPSASPLPSNTPSPSVSPLNPSASPTSASPSSLVSEAPAYISHRLPAQPVDCVELPEEPSILHDTKPQEPTPPIIPDGVTIPYSWPHPNSAPTVTRK